MNCHLTKGMFPHAKPGQPGYWLNRGEVEGGYGAWHWAIGDDGQIFMVMWATREHEYGESGPVEVLGLVPVTSEEE